METKYILKHLKFICDKLNDNNIDYYIVGALGAYIDLGHKPVRIHDDIDIMILEKDIDKLQNLFKGSDYIFVDNRKNTNKFLNEFGFTEGEEHEVYAIYKDNKFHIGFFMYEINELDYSIIEYYKENNIQKRLIRTLPVRYFDYQYDNYYKDYFGIKLKSVRKECIYNNKKNMKREKDIFDLHYLEKYLDMDIMDNLKGKSKYRTTKIETLEME